MKSSLSLLFASIFCSSLSGCVTTRDQLNEERGVGVEGAAETSSQSSKGVKSEDLSVKPKAPEQEGIQKNPEGVPATAPAPLLPGMQASAAATPKPDVSSYSADELRAEVAHLTGEVEELQHEKQTKEQNQAEEIKKAETRIAELEKKLKELQPEETEVPEGKTPFEAGKDAYIAQKCDEALVFLSQVVAKSDVGKEAEEATYLRGDCYFKKLQYNKAIVDFSHFPEKYQKSAFHPKALLRIAESFEAMGRKDDAKAFYSDLLEKFPKTAEGKLAKKRLKAKK